MTSKSVDTITLGIDAPTPMQRTRRADALANERLILFTASRLFAEQGIETVSMSAIAASAGIGKGTLYRAFANKGELCLAMMDDDLRRFQEETLTLLDARDLDSPLPLLAEFLHGMVAFMGNHATLMCVAEEHGALSGRSEINQTSLHEWFRLTVRLLLQRAERAEEITSDVDLDYLADAVLAPLNPRLIRHQLSAQRMSVGHVSEQLVRFVMTGVAGGCRPDDPTNPAIG